jgi:hypothetical protein
MTAATSRRTAERIHGLFAQGNSLDFISERGVYDGWSRADAEAVVDACGWELDPSGRVPRRYRDWPLPDPQTAGSADGLAMDPPAERAQASAPTRPPYVAVLTARQLFVDHSYQRPLDEPRVAEMAAAFDPHLLGILDVSDRGEAGAVDGPRYAIVDGQQRREAAVRAAELGEDLPMACNVHEGLTVASEAKLMRELDRRKKKLTGFEQWHTRAAAGDPTVLLVDEVCARHGLQVGSNPLDGYMRSYGTAEALIKLGGEQLLDGALSVLHAAYGAASSAYQAPLLRAVGTLLDEVADVDVERLARTLAANPPEQLRATATARREVANDPLHKHLTGVIAAAYNRTPGRGPRIDWSR